MLQAISSQLKGRCGRKLESREVISVAVRCASFKDSRTLRTAAFATEITSTTLFRALDDGALKVDVDGLRPNLTPKNKFHDYASICPHTPLFTRFQAYVRPCLGG